MDGFDSIAETVYLGTCTALTFVPAITVINESRVCGEQYFNTSPLMLLQDFHILSA